MKKIWAFLTALCLFVVAVFAFHTVTKGSLKTNNPDYGTWVNTYKDLSYDAISDNMDDDTVLVMGSSEFHHGRKTPYHPTKVFRQQHINAMFIGSAYRQCLTQATTVGAVAPKLKSRKVVPMLSPSWFGTEGVNKAAFSVRFSESEYVALLKNKDLSLKTRKAIAKRTVELLSDDRSMQKRVIRYNRMFLDGDASDLDKLTFKWRMKFIKEQENMNVNLAYVMSKQRRFDRPVKQVPVKSAPNWSRLRKNGERFSVSRSTNRFFMSDKFYKRKIVPNLVAKKNSATTHSYDISSPEYNDLKLFLQICKEENIKVMLVQLPVNGYWYDYTGFTADKRAPFITNTNAIAKEYGASVSDLYDKYSYTRGFFEDAAHPTGEGWVIIDEEIYKFIKQN